MPKPTVYLYHLNNELFDIFQQEIKELHQDVEAITMEKFNTECYYGDLLSEEREEKQSLLLEIRELKEKLEKAESKNQSLVGRDETTCCPTIQQLQQEMKEMEKKHGQEIEMLTIEFEIDVAVAQKEVKKLQEKLKSEKNLSVKSDSVKREAIKIPLKFCSHCEGWKKVSTEHSTKIKVRDEDIPYLDVQQLQEMLQRERKLRIQATNENLDQFKCAEAFFDMMEQELKTEQELRAQIEADKEEAVEIAEQLLKKLEDLEKTSKEAPSEITLDDENKTQLELQQLEKTIQEEKALRVQAENFLEVLDQELKTEQELRVQIEADKREAVEIAEQLLHKLEDLEKTSREGPSEISLSDRDKFELEVQQLEKMLQKEKRLRVQGETENASLLKTVEFLQQETDKKLQKERTLREEAERGKLELEKVRDQLYQGLEKACKITETLSAETKLLTKKLKAEDQKQRSLLKDVQELTLMLEREKTLRMEAENYEMGAVEIVEALQKEAKYRTWKNKDLKEKRHRIKVQPL